MSLDELRHLPGAWIRRLADFHNEWDSQGAWPEAVKRAIIALIPKPGAETEGQLRPIGVLSYMSLGLGCRFTSKTSGIGPWGCTAVRARERPPWSFALRLP